MKENNTDEIKNNKFLKEYIEADKYHHTHPLPATNVNRPELSIFKFLEGTSIWNREEKLQLNLNAKEYIPTKQKDNNVK